MDLQRLFSLADPRIRKIWDEKETQLSTQLEYAVWGIVTGKQIGRAHV